MTPTIPADLILTNGLVYTADARRSLAEAVAVAGGRIVYVGSSRSIEPWRGPDTRVIDLQGKMVLPGFHDAHIHAIGAAYGRAQIQLADVSDSQAAILARVSEFVKQHSGKPNYFGMGWEYSAFGQNGPQREDLDAICPEKPILLLSCDGHTAWVNSAALLLAGINRQTPLPPGGSIEINPDSGEPTGWLKEPAAFRLVLQKLSLLPLAQLKERLQEFLPTLSAEGITSIFLPGVELFEEEEIFGLLAELEKEGRLPVRLLAGCRCKPLDESDPVATILAFKKKYAGPWFRVTTAKLFLDGVMEAYTARLLQPYTDRPDSQGQTVWPTDALQTLVHALDQAGIQIHLHAIGDGAVRAALDCFAQARPRQGCPPNRHTVAHLDLVDPHDIPRFQELGIIANFQPTWFYPGPDHQQFLNRCLGEKRAGSLYSLKSFLDQGVVVACGSDYPVGDAQLLSFRPLDGIEMGTTRCALGEAGGEPYNSKEQVSRLDMIDSYTIRAAYQLFQEDEVGSLEIGKRADLVVLDRDILTTPPHEIHQARVLLTLVEGREVFRGSSF
jgi:hypothetical protein